MPEPWIGLTSKSGPPPFLLSCAFISGCQIFPVLVRKGVSDCRQACIQQDTSEWNQRAGTSPVNAVVRETIMERQVHFQSSD